MHLVNERHTLLQAVDGVLEARVRHAGCGRVAAWRGSYSALCARFRHARMHAAALRRRSVRAS